MAYSVQADVQTAVGGQTKLTELTARGAETVVNAALVTAAVTEADALIDSYAGKRFAVPFATTPPTIAALSAKIAARVLRRNVGMVLASDVEDEKTDRAWLVALSKGEVTLIGADGQPVLHGALQVDKAAKSDPPRAVSRERLRGLH